MKKTYRIPFKMFFDWFIPFSRLGNGWTAIILPQFLAVLYYTLVISSTGEMTFLLRFLVWFPWFIYLLGSPVFVPWAAVRVLTYHRTVNVAQAVLVGMVAYVSWCLLVTFSYLDGPRWVLMAAALFLGGPVALVSSVWASEASEAVTQVKREPAIS